MQFAFAVTIERPVDDVFEFAADLESVPEWAGPPIERVKLTDGPIGVGTRYRAVDQLPGRRIQFFEEITVYEPNRRVAARMEEPLNSNVEFVLMPEGDSTLLSVSIDMQPSGLIGMLMPVFGAALRKSFREDIDNLKAILESTDGRHSTESE